MTTFLAEGFTKPCPLCGVVPADGDEVRRLGGPWCHVGCIDAEVLLDELATQEARMVRAADLDDESQFR